MEKALDGEVAFKRQVTVNSKKTLVDTDASKIYFHQGASFGKGNDIYEEERTDGREHNFAKSYGDKHGVYYIHSLGFPNVNYNAALKFDKNSY